MPNIFLNRGEGRLRALWRIAIQAIIFIVFMMIGQIVVGVVAGLLAVANGASTSDPQAITQAAMSNPWVTAAAAVLTVIAVLLSYLIATKIDRRKYIDFGFHFNKAWWADLGFGLFLGAILMVFIFLVELSAGWITITGTFTDLPQGVFWTGIAVALIQFICVGIYEEMFSRGYQTRNLAEGLRGRFLRPRMALLVSYLITSSIFGLLHAGNPNATVTSTVLLVAAGLFLGLGYILTGELAIPIGIHITWNFFQGNVFGFPVSGTEAGASIIQISQGGPDLWTGGMFGPESGFIGLTAILLGCLVIAGWVKMTRKNVIIKSELAEYTPLISISNNSSIENPSQYETEALVADTDNSGTSHPL
jgi:uncharacterized protein